MERTTDTDHPMTDAQVQTQLELQLHGQYAINNNAYLGSIVVLLTALLAVFAGYGYVFLRTSLRATTDFGLMYGEDAFSLDALLLTPLAVVGVIAVCYVICAYQGCAQRKEQFIVDAIRQKYYGEDINGPFRLFPQDYSPWGKEGHQIFQGLYGLFMKLCYVAAAAVLLATAVKVTAFFLSGPAQDICLLCLELTVCLLLVGLVGRCCAVFYTKQVVKYNVVVKDYLAERYNSTNLQTNKQQRNNENKEDSHAHGSHAAELHVCIRTEW